MQMSFLHTASVFLLFFIQLYCEAEESLGEQVGVDFLVNDELYFIPLTSSTNLKYLVEEFCAISDIVDNDCKLASRRMHQRHEELFGKQVDIENQRQLNCGRFTQMLNLNGDRNTENWLNSVDIQDPYAARMGWCANVKDEMFRPNAELLTSSSSSSSSVAASLVQLAKIAIGPFRKHGVHLGEIDQILEHENSCTKVTMGDDGVSWSVYRANCSQINIDNQWVSPIAQGEDAWWRVRRRNSALAVLNDATRLLASHGRRIPKGVSLLICISDCLTTARSQERHPWRFETSVIQPNIPTPIFSLVACAGSDQISFPVFMNRSWEDDSYENWDKFKVNLQRTSGQIPFRGRIEQAVFRGGTHGKSCWNGTLNTPLTVQRRRDTQSQPLCGRRLLRLSVAASQYHSLFDVNYETMDFQDQLKYKAQIYVEGHCGWADRGRILMLSRSVLLWQETMCREWYSMLMKPWLHYIPVGYHFHNLEDAAAWATCNQNEVLMQAMVKRLALFADLVLSRESVLVYASNLLSEYASLEHHQDSRSDSAEGAFVNNEESNKQSCPSEDLEEYIQRTRQYEKVIL